LLGIKNLKIENQRTFLINQINMVNQTTYNNLTPKNPEQKVMVN